MSNLMFGSDPEYFICEKINGVDHAVPVPYFIENGLAPEIGYDPTRKHPVILRTEHSKVIMDGVAAEFNVLPAGNAHDLFMNIREASDVLNEFSQKFGYEMVIKPTVNYDFHKWFVPGNKALEQCGIFGCDPDKDAIQLEYSSPTIDVTTHQYRYGGGHLHITDNNAIIKDFPLPFIRCLALTVGNYTIAKSPYPELEQLRAFRYGQPGRFRIQHYPDGNVGVEYRSPSNVWTSSEELVDGVLYWANRAYELLNDPDRAMSNIDNLLDQTVEAIGTSNQSLAQFVLDSLK